MRYNFYLSKIALQQHYSLYKLLIDNVQLIFTQCCLNYQQHEDGKHHTVHLVCPMKTEAKSKTDSQATVNYVT